MEAPKVLGDARFSDLMLEMGLLVAAIAALGLTTAVLRRNGSGNLEMPNTSDAAPGPDRSLVRIGPE